MKNEIAIKTLPHHINDTNIYSFIKYVLKFIILIRIRAYLSSF